MAPKPLGLMGRTVLWRRQNRFTLLRVAIRTTSCRILDIAGSVGTMHSRDSMQRMRGWPSIVSEHGERASRNMGHWLSTAQWYNIGGAVLHVAQHKDSLERDYLVAFSHCRFL
jgi:hypothetical protein